MALMAAADQLVTPELAQLLGHLRDGRPYTRGQLVELTGLARSTVSNRLDALLDSGLVTTAGSGVSSGGRPAGYVYFRPEARTLLTVDLGATHGVVALTDLAGTVLEMEAARIAIADGPVPILDWVIAASERLTARLAAAPGQLAGIGVGLPGPVEHSTGIPTNPPIMPGWDGFDVPGYLGAHYDAPVLVDNDVNLLALGEHATVWRHVDDLLFVKVATGVGAGIISGGRLQRGAQGSAGDLGHVRAPYSSRRAGTDTYGLDLEAVASGPGIARSLARLGIDARDSLDVVELARTSDGATIEAIRQAGRDLGEVLSTCVNLLNPSVIVIGGSIARAGEHLVAGVREVIYGHSTPLATRQLTITESRAGETGGVIGAATMLAQHLLGPIA